MEGQLKANAAAGGASAGAAAAPLLQARGLVKQYPGVTALDRVDFDLRAGEVHALMGENGAGKTTLIRILTGAAKPDAGSLHLRGESKHFRSPAEAQRAGIAAVYQEIDLIPQLSVAENLTLGREPVRFGLIRTRQRDRAARAALARLGLDFDICKVLATLPIAAQQMVAIARALDMQARVLVLDEPTSCLDAAETARLFQILRTIRSNGLGIIFITHFLEQAIALSDRITVLRNGRRVACVNSRATTRLELVSHMLGREVREEEHVRAISTSHAVSPPIVQARHLGRRNAIAPFNLEIRRGEVVGLAGLLGSGRSEAARLVFGADRADTGEVRIAGRTIARPTPLRSLRAGMGMAPEDRKAQALIPSLSLEENLLLAVQAKRGWLRRLRRREREDIVTQAIATFRIVGPRGRAPIANLSGGNQQKAVLARWLATDPHVMILDEPTRGIDIGAKAEIERLIGSLRERGLAILFISAELEEVARDALRIIIVRDRAVAGELSADEATPQRIMREIAGGAAA